MAQSHNLTDVTAYQNHVLTFWPELVRKGFYVGKTPQLATLHAGVLGKQVIDQLALGTLGRRYDKAFNATETIKFTPRELVVEKAKFEYEFVPQAFRDTYMGAMQVRAFNNLEQIPYEGYVMESIIQKQNREIVNSFWQSVRPSTPATTDTLNQLYDGFLQLITADLAAGTPKLVPVAVPGGTITNTNIITLLENMWLTLDDDIRAGEVDAFLAPANWMKFQTGYRALYPGTQVNSEAGRMRLDFGMGVNVHYMPEMGNANRLVMTPRENLHIGFDNSVLSGNFNFYPGIRDVKYYYDFQLGVQFGILEAGVVAVSSVA